MGQTPISATPSNSMRGAGAEKILVGGGGDQEPAGMSSKMVVVAQREAVHPSANVRGRGGGSNSGRLRRID